MFYAHRVRREALQKSPEEYAKIIQVVQYYALDRASQCAFSLNKRSLQQRLDVQTDMQMNHVAVTRALFGDAIASALLPFSVEPSEELGLLPGCRGFASRTTFHGLKSAMIIIFLNGRLIEHAGLRRAMLLAFSGHMPTSPVAQPFIYLSLVVKGSRVDVNVHPSKRQVFLLDEAEIIKLVVQALHEQILTRQYETQAMQAIPVIERSHSAAPSLLIKNPRRVLYPSQRVQVDVKNGKIDSFLFNSLSQETGGSNWSPLLKRQKVSECLDEKENVIAQKRIEFFKDVSKFDVLATIDSTGSISTPTTATTTGATPTTTNVPMTLSTPTTTNVPMTLSTSTTNNHVTNTPFTPITTQITDAQQSHSSSCRPLDLLKQDALKSLLSSSNSQVSSLICSSVVVGVIDSQWCLLQSGTRLILADHLCLSREMFFWKAMTRGETCGSLQLEEPCGLGECFPGESEAVLEAARQTLKASSRVLKAFGIGLSEQEWGLSALPALIPGLRLPPRQNIRTFLTRLCVLPDREIQSVAGELSELFSRSSLLEGSDDWVEYLKFCLLPALNDSQVHYTLQQEGGALQIITDTETLYRSFERC